MKNATLAAIAALLGDGLLEYYGAVQHINLATVAIDLDDKAKVGEQEARKMVARAVRLARSGRTPQEIRFLVGVTM